MTKNILALLLCICAFVPRDAAALSYVMMQDETLLGQAEGVALFEVTSVEASPLHEETRYRLDTLSTLTGPALGKSETLVLPGFATEETRLLLNGIPFLRAGQTLLLFHQRRANGDLQAMQLTLGMFFPVETPRGELYVRYLDESSSRGGSKNSHYAVARDARAFERWVTLRGAGLHADIDYLTDMPETQAKFHLVQLDFANIPDGPGRWTIFEQGTAMRWFAPAAGQQAPMVENEFALLTAAITGWVSEPGSLILMNYAGTSVPSDPAPTDDAVVRWNDPNGQIPGDYNCAPNGGGIIGAGGSSATSERPVYNGEPYYKLRSGFLITQPSAGCILDEDDGRSGTEFFTHEIGHVLGFAHACGSGSPTTCDSDPVANAATMRSFLHSDGRGAVLGVDDVAAARFLYEDTNATVPSADLAVSIQAQPALVSRGDSIAYTIRVENDGPDAAQAVVVVHDLPAGTTFETAGGTGWNCNATSSTVTCARSLLGSSALSLIDVVVDVPTDYSGPSGMSSQVSVESSTDDPTSSNNSDTVITALDPIVGRIFGNSFE